MVLVLCVIARKLMLNPDRGSSLRLRLPWIVIQDGKFWSVGTLDVLREESLAENSTESG